MARKKKYELPSGTLRKQVYDHSEYVLDENGQKILDKNGTPKKKRVYVSISASTKAELELLVADYKVNKKKGSNLKNDPLSFKEARAQYIDLKSNVLSASTIRGYKQMNTYFDMLDDIDIYKMTQLDVQEWANCFSKSHAPKTVKNAHGLISAVLQNYQCNIILHTTLPQKIKPDLYIPTERDVQMLLKYFESKGDTDMLIAVHLASCATMRRSEICGLQAEDIKNNVIHVRYAAVLDDNKNIVLKTTKTISSDRYIDVPQYIINLLPKSGSIVNISPDVITSRFKRAIQHLGLHPFRFHDLRHYAASVMHAIGIPDQYIMERGGWSSDDVLKRIYRNTMSDYRKKFVAQTNEHFMQMQHEMQHEL